MHTEKLNPPTRPSPPSGPQNNRKWQRFPVELSSSISSTGSEWNGTAVNLSRQGCAISSATSVQSGDNLHVLIFPGANQTPIEVEVAQVRWASIGVFGVEFLTLVPREAIRLQDLLTLFGG